MTAQCDNCPEPAEWIAFAAYDACGGPGLAHPHVARYAAPMIRACNTHLIGRMWFDVQLPGTTGQFVVRPVE